LNKQVVAEKAEPCRTSGGRAASNLPDTVYSVTISYQSNHPAAWARAHFL